MITARSTLLTACLLIMSYAVADDSGIPLGRSDACMEGPLAQFGRYIGDWKIADAELARDGSGWSAGSGARWIFSCLGDGTAIQDFWLPRDGNVGTNLRTYNAETGSWEIAWAINTVPGFAHIRARQDDDGNIVMHYVQPEPDPLRRITFFPPDATGWNWTLEFSSDGGATWTEVYRIRATPFAAAAPD